MQLSLLVVCAALVSIAGAPRAARQQPIFRGGSDVVRVFVTVTDRDGRLVTTARSRFFSMHVQDLDIKAGRTPVVNGRGGGYPQASVGKGGLDWAATFERQEKQAATRTTSSSRRCR